MPPPRRRRVSRIARFRVSLEGIAPEIWRRFEIDAGRSFWDLHVAIQDTFGWQDCHLHAFEIPNALHRGGLLVGLPFPDDFGEAGCDEADWDVALLKVFKKPGDRVGYEYDFGDSWGHEVVLEAIEDASEETKVPRCLDGARAAPPDDAGGVGGYEVLLAALADPGHERHEELLNWAPRGFDPERFDPAAVVFHDPWRRLRQIIEADPFG